jgi:hypothetical protein
MVAVSDGKSRPRAMRLHLSLELVRLQSQSDAVDDLGVPSPPPNPRRPSDLLSPAAGGCSSPGAISASSQPPEDGSRAPPPDARVSQNLNHEFQVTLFLKNLKKYVLLEKFIYKVTY